MRVVGFLLLACTIAIPSSVSAQAAVSFQDAERLCRNLNPALDTNTLELVVPDVLAKPHDPALDAFSVAELARMARDEGARTCGLRLQRDAGAFKLLLDSKGPEDNQFAWDAWNTACNRVRGSAAPCIRKEIAAVHFLRAGQDENPVKRNLVALCQLTLANNATHEDSRICVDAGLRVAPSSQAVSACKFEIDFHSQPNGRAAAHQIAPCLQKRTSQ